MFEISEPLAVHIYTHWSASSVAMATSSLCYCCWSASLSVETFCVLSVSHPMVSCDTDITSSTTTISTLCNYTTIQHSLSLTYKLLNTTQPYYLYNLISLRPPRCTHSSSVVTLARPPTRSSLKITDRSF